MTENATCPTGCRSTEPRRSSIPAATSSLTCSGSTPAGMAIGTPSRTVTASAELDHRGRHRQRRLRLDWPRPPENPRSPGTVSAGRSVRCRTNPVRAAAPPKGAIHSRSRSPRLGSAEPCCVDAGCRTAPTKCYIIGSLPASRVSLRTLKLKLMAITYRERSLLECRAGSCCTGQRATSAG